MDDATALHQTTRRRSRFSTLLANASMCSWVILGAMPIAAAIVAFT